VGAPDGASPQHLVDVAVLLAQACAAQVHVVSVLPTGPEWVPTTNPNSMWQIERRRRLDRWMPVLEARELRHEFHVVESTDPFDAWARIARDVHADLIIASADKRSNPVSRRHASVVRLARTTGLVVVSVPGGTEVHDG
jgi:nucleotide-binding universal stress UspA family protein